MEEGQRFGLRLEIRKTGSTPPCTSAIADRAWISSMGSGGAFVPWPEEERKVLENDRFRTILGDRAAFGRTADNILELAEYAMNPRQPNGWFVITIATTAGALRYCYVFKPAATGTTTGAAPSIGGTWYREGDRARPASVEQNGATLSFVNEFGNRSRGRFDGADVIAIDWNNLRGRLLDNNSKIAWANNTNWSRGPATARPALAGRWYREGDRARPASVEQNGETLSFVNEFGNRSRGRFDGAEVIAIDWNNLRGRLLNNATKIAWANNTNWSR